MPGKFIPFMVKLFQIISSDFSLLYPQLHLCSDSDKCKLWVSESVKVDVLPIDSATGIGEQATESVKQLSEKSNKAAKNGSATVYTLGKDSSRVQRYKLLRMALLMQ